MRRVGVVLGVAVVMAAAVALTAGMALAQAETDTFSVRLPFDGGVLNTCTGESFALDGTVHIVAHRSQDADGKFHFSGVFNAQGLGESESGAKYVVIRSYPNNNNFDVTSDSAENFTTTLTVLFQRQGSDTPEDDAVLKQLIHFTTNANGELTAEVLKEEFECK